jgi:hypothetical protein
MTCALNRHTYLEWILDLDTLNKIANLGINQLITKFCRKKKLITKLKKIVGILFSPTFLFYFKTYLSVLEILACK